MFALEIHIINSKDHPTFPQFKKVLSSIFKRLPKLFTLTYLDEDEDEITLTNSSDFSVLLQTDTKSVKIFIKEVSEQFFDKTIDINIEPLEYLQGQKQEEVKQEEVKQEDEKELHKQLEVHEQLVKPIEEVPNNSFLVSQASEIQNLDKSIEEKLKEMMPEIISKIKTEVAEEVIEKSKVIEDKLFEPILQEKIIHPHITCDGCNIENIEGVRYKCSVCADFDFCEKCQASIEHLHAFLKIKHPRQTPIKIFTIINDQNNESFEVNGKRIPMNGISSLINQGANLFHNFFVGNQCGNQSGNQGRNQRYNFFRNFQENQGKQEEKVGKKQEKTEQKKQLKNEEPKKKKIFQNQQGRIARNAGYLKEILGESYNRCYKFAQRFNFMDESQLLNHALENSLDA